MSLIEYRSFSFRFIQVNSCSHLSGGNSDSDAETEPEGVFIFDKKYLKEVDYKYADNPLPGTKELSKELTTVTSFSKILAAVIFITLPFVGFYLGIKYEAQFTQYLEDRMSIDQYMTKPNPVNKQKVSAAKLANLPQRGVWV